MKELLKMTGKVKPTPAQALDGLKIMLDAFKENHKVTEEEQTKRANIAAMKEFEIEKIKAQKEVMQDYFEKVFHERRVNFDKMFDALDKGIENNNIEMIQMSLSTIVTMAKESPLNQVQQLTSDFKNPDVDEIEI